MRGREIVLLILIICAGVFFYHAQTGKIDWDVDWGDGFFFGHEEFVFEETQDIDTPLPPLLQITNEHGDVEIQGWTEDRITIVFQERIWRRNEEQAKEVADRLRMTLDQDEQALILSSNRGDFRRKNFETNFRISLPAGMAVKVDNAHGLVRVTDVRKADIRNRHDDVIASGIQEGLVLENSYDDVEVSDVRGHCRISNRHADVTVSNIQGSLSLTHGYGEVSCEDVAQDVTIDGSHTKVFGQNISGQTEVQSSYEKIVLNDVGPVIIRGNHSPVEVSGADSLDLFNRYSRVTLAGIRGNVKIEGKSLQVTGRQITGEEILISTSYETVELTEFSGKTQITLSHGRVELQPALLAHPFEVRGEYTDILFVWPAGARNPLEARVKNGEIKWELPFELSLEKENGISLIKAFQEEADKPPVYLSTSYATIRIE